MDKGKKVSFQEPDDSQLEEKELLVVVKDHAGEKQRKRKRSRSVSKVSMDDGEKMEENSAVLSESVVSRLKIKKSNGSFFLYKQVIS